jgi:isocitrate dehydrogenase
MAELNVCQGEAIDIGGYYHPDREKTIAAMRPSKTLNNAIAALVS